MVDAFEINTVEQFKTETKNLLKQSKYKQAIEFVATKYDRPCFSPQVLKYKD